MYATRAPRCSSSSVVRVQHLLLLSRVGLSMVLSAGAFRTSNVALCRVNEVSARASGPTLVHRRLCHSCTRDSSAALSTKARCIYTAALAATRVSCVSSPLPPACAASATTQAKSASLLESAGSSTDAAELPVSPVLVETIKLIMSRHATMTWMPVSNLYADLTPRTRREHVRPHKSMLNVLQKVKDELGISLNATGVFYAVGKMPDSAPPPRHQAQQQKPTSATKDSDSHEKQPSQRGEGAAAASAAKTVAPSPHPSTPTSTAIPSLPASALEELAAPVIPPVDFFYDVGLKEFPPPPADLDISPAQLQRHVTRSSVNGAVIAMSDFVAYIPPFFTPLREVLAHMPGYTEAHIQRYFQASSMEVVTVSGEKYIRVHGGYEKLSLVGCEEAEKTFQQFRPLPSLAVHFEEAFKGVTDKWIPLLELLSRVDPAVVAQLPFQGPAAVMYFAQMQHKFAFAVRQLPPQQEGAAPTTEAAVLLRRPDYGGLESNTTPTPKSLSYIFPLIPCEGQVEILDVERQLPDHISAELKEYYGGLSEFFSRHATIFYVPPETPTVVMRLRYRQRVHVATLSLEEQLKYAQENGKKAKIRVIRRRIAFRDNPSHPFLEPENLAKELSSHLPRRGFVSVKSFLKRSIPEELLMFMPPKLHNFFKNYPQYFTQFEYQSPGTWCLCRPDQPLPRGVIRQSFSEGDMVRMIAEFLQKRGPRPLSTVLLNMPRGAQDTMKKRYGGMYFFVIRYPQYFNVVLGSDNDNAQSSGMVHLIQVPSAELNDTAMAAAGSVSNNPHAPTADVLGEKTNMDDEGDDDDYDGLD
ncbi:hypothetical protein ABL78_7356 [Leptomonas seymouri]|uniref:HTH OST-type domain-containing protein n=1 Tax=Leptomonas seymouri TaxID=5684 RepID=A0A0N1HU37_LEPSE|nr:hypothetical protein ABL78_7356 [Leptomonas seymouri]|eukprot:KPI83603.1 hypothetical protein ABL78_7356 [Leptomonas seymouri]